MTSNELNTALASAQSAGQALRMVYQHYKKLDKKYSLTWLAERAGFSSRGHILDAMGGRRPVSLAQVKLLCAALKLPELSARILRTLAALGPKLTRQRRVLLERRLLVLRKALLLKQVTSAGTPPPSTLLALDLFTAFWLFGTQPTTADLAAHFKRKHTRLEIEAGLQQLLAAQMIRRSGARWEPREGRVSFISGEDRAAVAALLRQSMRDAMAELERWLPETTLSHFETVSISVDRAAYDELLRRFKDEMLLWQSRLEAPAADMVVRLNIQLYPVP